MWFGCFIHLFVLFLLFDCLILVVLIATSLD